MEIKLNIKSRTLIIALSGELDHHAAQQIRMMIEGTLMERNIKNLIFDFTALSFMDSSGIGMIIGRFKQIKSLGGQVALVCNNQTITRLVEMSGLKRLIKVFNSLNLAMEEMKEA